MKFFSILCVRTIHDENGLETKKRPNIELGWEMIVNMNIPVDSVSAVSFRKHENVTRTQVDQGSILWFHRDMINVVAKIIIKTQSNEWICEKTQFFITGGHERNIFGNNNLPKLGIEVKQKKFSQLIRSVSHPPRESMLNKFCFA